MEEIKMKLRKKWICILWLMLNGFFPMKKYFKRIIKFPWIDFNFFNYNKFKECGKVQFMRKLENESSYGNRSWKFPKQLLLKVK